jgi:hypothetical protein
MKRPMSAFEQELAAAMDEYAHSTEPPAFDPGRIATRERRRIRVRISLAAVGVATAAGIAACVATAGLPGNSHAGLPVVGQTTSRPSSATATPPPSPTAAPPNTGASTTPGSNPSAPSGTVPTWPTTPTSSPFAGSVPPVPVLTSIRTGAHPEGGYDRISLEFTGQLPGFKAEYATSIVHQGSGAPISLPGSAYLQLTFTSAQAHDANGNPTLSPDPINPTPVNLPELRAYVLNGDFEGTVSIALGLTAPDGFHVSELTKSPTDHVIYVDIARTR